MQPDECKVLEPMQIAPYNIRVVCLGDTYGINEPIPTGDICIHTGNFSTFTGSQITEFINYISGLPHKYKIIVGGFNENKLSSHIIRGIGRYFPNIMYLDGAATQIYGLRIYCVTYIDNDQKISYKPFNCINDIVISHYPPAGILDLNHDGENIGSIELLENLDMFPPKICVFSGAPCTGSIIYKGILCINVGVYNFSVVCQNLQNTHWVKHGKPTVLDIMINPL